MRVKTSVTLAEETIRAIDEIAEAGSSSRSRVIEEAVIEHLERRRRSNRDARDRQILDAEAKVLNREVEDELAYQIES